MPTPLRSALACGMLAAAALLAAPLAAQPVNDLFTRAVPLVQAGTYVGSNVGATSGGNILRSMVHPEPVPSCLTAAQSAPNSVWWWFVPSQSGSLTLSLANSSFDTVLSVHRFTSGSFVEVACDDDELPGTIVTSRVQLAVTQGDIYLVRVAGFNGAEGTVALAASPTSLLQTPPDDHANYALDLYGDGVYPGSTVGATHGNTGDPAATCVSAANDGGNSVWRYVYPQQNTTVTISTAGSSFDTVLSVLREDGATLTEVACNDDTPGDQGPSTVTVALTTGQAYYVRVVGYQGASGTLQYTVSGLGAAPVAVEGPAPTAPTALTAPAPNPTAGTTTLHATLATAADVDLSVYDLLGRRVATLLAGPRPAGPLEATWDAAGVPPGVYVARLTAGGAVSTQRITVAR